MTGKNHVLYRIYDAADSLLYVGATINPKERFADHQAREWWRDVATIRFEHYEDAESLTRAEKAAIEAERPRYNWIHAKPLPWTRKNRSTPGRGTLFLNSRGLWVARVELPSGPDGKRRVKQVARKDRRQAELVLEQLRCEYGR